MTESYKEISSVPEQFTAGAVVSRALDGFGFRYFWATENLLEQDYGYKPDGAARNISETMEHIHSLTLTMCKMVNIAPSEVSEEGNLRKEVFLRQATLLNIKKLSSVLKESTTEELNSYYIESRANGTKYTIWQLINGPIEDGVWHAGQIVLLRRLSGNPIPEGVNFFTGTVIR